jgi:hypothetical protein
MHYSTSRYNNYPTPVNFSALAIMTVVSLPDTGCVQLHPLVFKRYSTSEIIYAHVMSSMVYSV